MAHKVSIAELERAVGILSVMSGVEYGIDRAYGGFKLTDKYGAQEFSKRATKTELYDQVSVAITVLRRKEQGG